jgi:predicted ATPase
MKIKQLEFEDKTANWKLQTTLFSNLTLLVGVSGVGKTQILNSIWQLTRIADGKSVNGVKWNVLFETKAGQEYQWCGEYESKPLLDEEYIDEPDEEIRNKSKIETEKLILNGENIVVRERSEIRLKGVLTPKLSPTESVLSILSEEEEISPARNSFKRIIRSDFSNNRRILFSRMPSEYEKMAKCGCSLEEIQESSLDSSLKVGLLYSCVPEIFEQIKARYIDIFPQVEDVRFEKSKERSIFFSSAASPNLEIKEKGVQGWIEQRKISSGMFKTFMHLSEMYLWPSGTVVLIDEFENSLGVNCINFLTEDILEGNRRLQFIVTSHHPYIINNISPKFWKLVTRQGGIVTTHDSTDLQLSNSHHSAFIQLINLNAFKEGIATL